MKRHLRDRASTVRLPRGLQEASARLPQVRQQLTARLGREPSPAELAVALQISRDDLARIEEGTSPSVDGASDNAFEELEGAPDRILLAGAFESLEEPDRRILYLRFVKEQSRRETAKELGMSEAALARRTDAALARLRVDLEGQAFESAAPATRAKKTPRPAEKREQTHSGKLLLRMPQSLHAELAEAADRDDVSLNQYITNALSAAVGWHHETASGGAPDPPRWLPAALVTNIVVVVIAGVAALVLLVVALQQAL
jgi:hypothetical protein